jgi:hypothetical protein
MPSLAQRIFAEWLGTAFLLAAVVGSGIMAAKLAGGNVALALLCNTIATGAILAVLILVFGPLSGAHFNPAVSVAFALRRALPWREAGFYSAAQVAGGIVGVWAAHLMFELPVWQFSTTMRTGAGQWLAEAVAACGRALRRGTLHHVSLLVHGVHLVRQSGRHHRARIVRYVCGHRSGQRAGVHRCAVPWGSSSRRRWRVAVAEGEEAGHLMASDRAGGRHGMDERQSRISLALNPGYG